MCGTRRSSKLGCGIHVSRVEVIFVVFRVEEECVFVIVVVIARLLFIVPFCVLIFSAMPFVVREIE